MATKKKSETEIKKPAAKKPETKKGETSKPENNVVTQYDDDEYFYPPEWQAPCGRPTCFAYEKGGKCSVLAVESLDKEGKCTFYGSRIKKKKDFIAFRDMETDNIGHEK